jgi:radical SAM protein with 4Fe4S-binding SPASM domain
MSENAHELDAFLAYWRDKAELFSIQNLHNPFDGALRAQKNRYFVGGAPTPPRETPRCPSPFQRMTIRANGNVLPCCNMRAAETLVIGNARETSLHAIWNAAPMQAIRAMHKAGRYQENPVCKACIENSDAWAPEVR